MEEVKARAGWEVFGLTYDNGENEILKAVSKSRKDIKTAMDCLTWWKLLWKVDDVGDIMTTAIDRAWCKDLEHKVCLPLLQSLDLNS